MMSMSGQPVSDENGTAAALLAVYGSHAKKNGLTVPTLRALEAVCLHPDCTQKTLCEDLCTSKQRVSQLVRALEQKLLLRRTGNGADGRSRLLRAAPAGVAVVEALWAETRSGASGEAAPSPHTHILEDGTVIVHSHGEGHGHIHSHQHTKAVLDRLARCIGHLEKVRRMVEAGEDCSEVLIQLSAVRAAVNSTGKLILKDHIEHCLVDAIEHGEHGTVEELNRAIDRFIK